MDTLLRYRANIAHSYFGLHRNMTTLILGGIIITTPRGLGHQRHRRGATTKQSFVSMHLRRSSIIVGILRRIRRRRRVDIRQFSTTSMVRQFSNNINIQVNIMASICTPHFVHNNINRRIVDGGPQANTRVRGFTSQRVARRSLNHHHF